MERKTIDKQTMREIEEAFGERLFDLRYDLGGSLADLVEEALHSVLVKLVEKEA